MRVMSSLVSLELPVGPRFSLVSAAIPPVAAKDFRFHKVAGAMPKAVAILAAVAARRLAGSLRRSAVILRRPLPRRG